MIDYVDPIPPVVQMMNRFAPAPVYGNSIPAKAKLPCIAVRAAGGNDGTRLQIIVRAKTDYEAMSLFVTTINILQRNTGAIKGLRVLWIEKESMPIHSVDQDTGSPEAWGYIRMEHLEA
ncbi:MAG: hypothetical protein ACI35R_17445 [Bacillus sp. (in: firmicutes)]